MFLGQPHAKKLFRYYFWGGLQCRSRQKQQGEPSLSSQEGKEGAPTDRLVVCCPLGHGNRTEQPLLGWGAREGKPRKVGFGEIIYRGKCGKAEKSSWAVSAKPALARPAWWPLCPIGWFPGRCIPILFLSSISKYSNTASTKLGRGGFGQTLVYESVGGKSALGPDAKGQQLAQMRILGRAGGIGADGEGSL